MRDVFDYCTKNKLHSVAQGMIELPPPRKLREIVSAAILDDSQQHINQYRNRFGEPPYLQAIQRLLEKHYATKVPLGAILATSGYLLVYTIFSNYIIFSNIVSFFSQCNRSYCSCTYDVAQTC